MRSVPGNPEHATGYNKALAAEFGQSPRPPISSCSGRRSPPVSLARCMLPYALRDPYRLVALQVGALPVALADAKEYLRNLNNSANVGLLDMIMPGWQDYCV